MTGAAPDERSAGYHGIDPEALTLRDRLATDRTVLANERTFLAYLRSAFAFVAGGASLIHFVDRGWALAVGWLMIPAGALLLAWGVHRFLSERRRLGPLRRAAEADDRRKGGSP